MLDNSVDKRCPQKRKSTSSLSECWLTVEKGCPKSENQQAHSLNAGEESKKRKSTSSMSEWWLRVEKIVPKIENQQAEHGVGTK